MCVCDIKIVLHVCSSAPVCVGISSDLDHVRLTVRVKLGFLLTERFTMKIELKKQLNFFYFAVE